MKKLGKIWRLFGTLAIIIILSSLILIVLGCNPTKSKSKPPNASFTYDNSSSLKLYLYNESSGEYTSSSWNFGDGNSSSSKSPAHTYSSSGIYNVMLTVEGPGGTDTESKQIFVKTEKSVEFTRWWAKVNNSVDIVWIYADLEIKGYQGREFTVGGYWFRKKSDGYYYVYSDCESNIPNNYLGRQWNIRASYESTRFNELDYNSRFNCFREKFGTYYGSIALYNTSSIGIDPNSTTLAQTGYVSISFNSASQKIGSEIAAPAQPVIQILTEEESQQLRDEIERLGGIRPALDI